MIDGFNACQPSFSKLKHVKRQKCQEPIKISSRMNVFLSFFLSQQSETAG